MVCACFQHGCMCGCMCVVCATTAAPTPPSSNRIAQRFMRTECVLVSATACGEAPSDIVDYVRLLGRASMSTNNGQ